jgi:hypothetical protein
MTEISGSPAEDAARFDVFSFDNPLPLGHPGLDRDAVATVDAVEHLVYSSHPDDRLAVTSIHSSFRAADSPYVPENLPRLDEMHRHVLWWMSELDRPDLEAFLRWNVDRQAMQQERLRADIFDLQGTSVAHAEVLAGHRLLRPEAPEAMVGALALTTYRAMDSFTSGGLHAAGFCPPNAAIMALRNFYSGGDTGFAELEPGAQKVHTHESLHRLHIATNSGLGTILPEANDPASTQWTNEAFVEHGAQVALTGDPQTMSPEQRSVPGTGSNLRDRELMAAVNLAGNTPLELWAEAFAEPLSADRQPARRELHRRLGVLSARLFPELEGRNLAHAIGENISAVPMAHVDRVLRIWITQLEERS